VQEVVDQVNDRYARVEQIKKFAILPRDLSQEEGELTPSLKVKRKVVHERHLDLISALYSDSAPSETVGAGAGTSTP
jgi:long-chain acyl-CoA synthetase